MVCACKCVSERPAEQGPQVLIWVSEWENFLCSKVFSSTPRTRGVNQKLVLQLIFDHRPFRPNSCGHGRSTGTTNTPTRSPVYFSIVFASVIIIVLGLSTSVRTWTQDNSNIHSDVPCKQVAAYTHSSFKEKHDGHQRHPHLGLHHTFLLEHICSFTRFGNRSRPFCNFN